MLLTINMTILCSSHQTLLIHCSKAFSNQPGLIRPLASSSSCDVFFQRVNCLVMWFFHRISGPSQVATPATPVNPRTPQSLRPHPLHRPLTWTTDTPDPATATATDMVMAPATVSTTAPLDFTPTTAATETDVCQAKWAAWAWAPRTGEKRRKWYRHRLIYFKTFSS